MATWVNPVAMYEDMLRYISLTGNILSETLDVQEGYVRYIDPEDPEEAYWDISVSCLADIENYRGTRQDDTLENIIRMYYTKSATQSDRAMLLYLSNNSGLCQFQTRLIRVAARKHSKLPWPFPTDTSTLFEKLLEDPLES